LVEVQDVLIEVVEVVVLVDKELVVVTLDQEW
jgi:hypothetical protein